MILNLDASRANVEPTDYDTDIESPAADISKDVLFILESYLFLV